VEPNNNNNNNNNTKGNFMKRSRADLNIIIIPFGLAASQSVESQNIIFLLFVVVGEGDTRPWVPMLLLTAIIIIIIATET